MQIILLAVGGHMEQDRKQNNLIPRNGPTATATATATATVTRNCTAHPSFLCGNEPGCTALNNNPESLSPVARGSEVPGWYILLFQRVIRRSAFFRCYTKAGYIKYSAHTLHESLLFNYDNVM
jgi:hypothetical protein